jgi:ribose transport system ATP-binding protein
MGYTLSSIAAVILGGTSITGGRGSFIGTLVAAFLVQELINVTVFLGLSAAWEQYLLGGIILVAVGAYARTLQGIRS